MAIFRKKLDDTPRRRQQSSETRESSTSRTDRQTFRRNRTLTGSTSDRVSSSSHVQPDMTSHRSHVHRLAHVRRRMGSLLMIILLGIIILFWLLTQLTAQVTISFADSTMNSAVKDTTIYQRAINDYLAINPLSRLRFLLDVDKLNQYLTTTVAEVDSVSDVRMGAIGETKYSLVMRKPVAGWKLGDKQLYVDAKGVAFERNYYSNPSVQIVDESGASLRQGTLIASNQFLGFVGRVLALTKDRGYTVTDAILPAGTTRQLEIKLQGVVPLVKFSIDRPAGEQVEDMARSLVYLNSRGVAPSYIDVRVSNKAFYK